MTAAPRRDRRADRAPGEGEPTLGRPGIVGELKKLGVTTNPDNPWVTQVVRNFATGLEEAGRRFRFLVRDRDGKFTSSFDTAFASIGIEAVKTPVRAPRAIAYAERWGAHFPG